ncbi:glycosyltransferase family 2 protein [Candidatus Pacearchaeota archaeon]|nr:glycosyltransferase family 2 protein [Candidatus Staskawiczbacteria bacterium]MBM3230340.1 glycosyltransferase family 2 protein [Candidatus Pacearchaeota archaeon]
MDLSVVIPTYNEKENIVILINNLKKKFNKNRINGEIIIVDDNSPDGTGDLLDYISKKDKKVRVIHRTGKLGLSSAVLAGFKISKSKVLAVMDADLSHPSDSINKMYSLIKDEDVDIVIGSRYVKGGNIVGWGNYRKILSKGATFLARVFTNIKDPMSGFFMIKKECLNGIKINPKGFKILLEIIVKAKYSKIKEVPIIFTNRVHGKSKAGIKEIIYYLRNLSSYIFSHRNLSGKFIKFSLVGLIGTFINLAVLYSFTELLGVYYIFSAILSFFLAASSNFILNKVLTFNESIKYKILSKYYKFLIVSICALIINLAVLYSFTELLGVYYLISQIIAIGFSFILNFIGNKIWTFSN